MKQYTEDERIRIFKRLARVIREMENESGWMKSETSNTFLDCAIEMTQHGFGIEEIKYQLARLADAIRNEYGD